MPITGYMRFDRRILERNLKSGIITEEEYRKFLKDLKDASDSCAPIESELAPVGHPVPGRKIEEEEEL